MRSKKNTFRFTQNNHISFYQSGTFRFAGLKTILFHTYITWIIAMLNNEELWAKALEFATVLQNFSTGNKQGKTSNSRKVDEVLKATNKKNFIESLVEIVGNSTEVDVITKIASLVNTMPTENVPYFLTLVRFRYAEINNNK